ncbi:MAG: two-component system, NarL family, sensor histidine kinase EvgS [Actinomycetota bacterium]|jgi:CheY-like chemotaxis protein
MNTANAHSVDRVLYIEDSVINRTLMERMFAKLLPDVELQTAPDGESGLRLLRETNPAVLLLDCHLPGISGLDVLETARAAGNEVPVVVVTADASVALEAQMLAAGAEDVVTKPVEFPWLLSRITKYLPGSARESLSGQGCA